MAPNSQQQRCGYVKQIAEQSRLGPQTWQPVTALPNVQSQLVRGQVSRAVNNDTTNPKMA